jgi:hypothetical protein
VLCGHRLRAGQPRNYYHGQLAHQKCVSRHRRGSAPPAPQQHSCDDMEDGLHALRTAALQLLH